MSRAYAETNVPIPRSQEQIRGLLVKAGIKGVQFTEDWSLGTIGFRFVKTQKFEQAEIPLVVSMRIDVWKKPADRLYATVAQKAQRERRVWRALYWYLKAQLEAVDFGLRTFEDVFLADLEMRDGRTLKDHVGAALHAGRLALPETVETP